MRKWINIVEAVVLVAMLVFVVGFNKYYRQPIYIENRYNKVGASWDGNKLVSPENQHATFIANRWHAVGYDRDGKSVFPSLVSIQSISDALMDFDPEQALWRWGEEWKNKQNSKNSLYISSDNSLDYDIFMDFISEANKHSTIHLYGNAIKGYATINIGDIVAVWEEIDKGKFDSKPVQEIIKTENDSINKDLFAEMYFYIEQKNGKVARFKLYRGLTKGEGTASFRFLSKSAYPVIESMKVEVK